MLRTYLVHGIGSESVATWWLPQKANNRLWKTDHLQKWHDIYTSEWKKNIRPDRLKMWQDCVIFLDKFNRSYLLRGKNNLYTDKVSLHSSVIEGSEPDGWRHKMDRDQHLPVLFEGLLKPLNQADRLVLQGVHFWSVRPGFLLLLLRLRCGAGLWFLLWWLGFRLIWCSAEGWSWQPALAHGCRWWRRQAEGTATKYGGWFEDRDPHQQGPCCCQPLQSAMV